ncbi:hypothetical protein [Demequina litorisediminis]|nr:hypothetical protein [Demequina litorisediminis]
MTAAHPVPAPVLEPGQKARGPRLLLPVYRKEVRQADAGVA